MTHPIPSNCKDDDANVFSEISIDDPFMEIDQSFIDFIKSVHKSLFNLNTQKDDTPRNI